MSAAPTSVAPAAPRPSLESNAVSWATFFSTYLPAMVLSLGAGIALPAIPVLAKSFDVTFGQASFVITAFLVGGLSGTLPTGWLLDKLGRRPVMIAGPLLTSAMALMVVFSHSFPELLIYRFLDGWASQMWMLARLAGISARATAGQRGRQVSWMFGMDNVGRLSGPLVGGFIAAAWGPRATFGAYALLALVALVPSLGSLRGRESPVTQRREDSRRMSIGEIILPRLAFFGVAFFSALARGPIFADMLHLYAAFAYNLNARTIGFLAATSSALVVSIGFAAGYLLDRYGRKLTMVPGFFSIGVTMLGLAVTAWLHLSFFWYVVAFVTTVAAQSLTGGSIQTVGTDVAPPEARGMFLGLWRFTGQLGTSLSPIGFAFLADRSGYGASFVFVAAAALVTGLLLVTVIPETRNSGASVPALGKAG